MLGYIIQQDPSPAMIVYPSDKLGESISENRIKPMLKSSPALKRLFKEFQSQKLELQFDGMYLTISGANSPSSLASKAIKYLFLDEVDKYPGASKKEADPISLARERVKTFRNSKVYLTSTPTISAGHIWKSLMGADIEKHYFVTPYTAEDALTDDYIPGTTKLVFLQFILGNIDADMSDIRGTYWFFKMKYEKKQYKDLHEAGKYLRSLSPEQFEQYKKDIYYHLEYDRTLEEDDDLAQMTDKWLKIEDGLGKLQDIKKQKKNQF